MNTSNIALTADFPKITVQNIDRAVTRPAPRGTPLNWDMFKKMETTGE
jgi:hypothetical protein